MRLYLSFAGAFANALTTEMACPAMCRRRAGLKPAVGVKTLAEFDKFLGGHTGAFTCRFPNGCSHVDLPRFAGRRAALEQLHWRCCGSSDQQSVVCDAPMLSTTFGTSSMRNKKYGEHIKLKLNAGMLVRAIDRHGRVQVGDVGTVNSTSDIDMSEPCLVDWDDAGPTSVAFHMVEIVESPVAVESEPAAEGAEPAAELAEPKAEAGAAEEIRIWQTAVVQRVSRVSQPGLKNKAGRAMTPGADGVLYCGTIDYSLPSSQCGGGGGSTGSGSGMMCISCRTYVPSQGEMHIEEVAVKFISNAQIDTFLRAGETAIIAADPPVPCDRGCTKTHRGPEICQLCLEPWSAHS